MRSRTCPSASTTILRGAAAGLLGTLAMDALWYARYRRGGGEDSFWDWERSAGTTAYDEAGAPAQVGRRIVEGYLQRPLPPASAAPMNTVVHLLTGVGWGVAHAVVTTSTPAPQAASGPLTGVAAWGASYALLAPAGIYEPIWTYSRDELWQDLSAHLLFGLGTGAAFGALARDRPASA